MNQDRIWELMGLKLAGEISQSELAELEGLLRRHPEEGLRMEKLETIWKSRMPSGPVSRKEAFNRHMQRLSNHLSDPVLQYDSSEEEFEPEQRAQPRSSGFYRKLYWATGIAASLIAIFLFFTLREDSRTSNTTAQNTISTKRGSKSKVQLPDGTQVWLNADSRITYKENFLGAQREVELTGEAYFDVVRDETRPFIIHTATIDLKVLGTAFNVRSYADEKNTETSLIHGSVEITLVKSPDRKKIILKPNDKLIVQNNEIIMEQVEKTKTALRKPVMTLSKINYKDADSSAIETLWVKNKLAFDEEPLEDIALKIERWYDVKVYILDERLKKEPYTATFEHETLTEVMAALQEGGGFKYSIHRNEVMIKR